MERGPILKELKLKFRSYTKMNGEFEVRGGNRCEISPDGKWRHESAYADSWREMNLHEVTVILYCQCV